MKGEKYWKRGKPLWECYRLRSLTCVDCFPLTTEWSRTIAWGNAPGTSTINSDPGGGRVKKPWVTLNTEPLTSSPIPPRGVSWLSLRSLPSVDCFLKSPFGLTTGEKESVLSPRSLKHSWALFDSVSDPGCYNRFYDKVSATRWVGRYRLYPGVARATTWLPYVTRRVRELCARYLDTTSDWSLSSMVQTLTKVTSVLDPLGQVNYAPDTSTLKEATRSPVIVVNPVSLSLASRLKNQGASRFLPRTK
jgi:hypothetical protein